jgi:hypothetical protein
MGERVRVYFGQPTPIEAKDEHLPLPDAGKLFFISPPPSPPHGWEMKLEDAPNKQVHAEDLAEALAKLHHRAQPDTPAMSNSPGEKGAARHRSGSATTIYRPEDHGDSPLLPAIAVEDFTGEEPTLDSGDAGRRPKMIHTARPAVELMDRT